MATGRQSPPWLHVELRVLRVDGTLREGLWIGWPKTDVKHAHEAFRDNVEQKTANKFRSQFPMGGVTQRERTSPTPVSVQLCR